MRKLATGGMAEVFLARPTNAPADRATLVVKRMLPHLAVSPEFVQMFLSEARVGQHLKHPRVVRLHDSGRSGGTYFIAMEYVDGLTLRGMLNHVTRTQRAVPYRLWARVMSWVCEGVGYVHKAIDSVTQRPLSLIHRDLNPDNVLLGRDGSVKIADFGVAKSALNIHRTREGMLKGKLAYMSCEQLKGEPLDPRADIFSLGIMLYELLTGSRPFGNPTDAELVRCMLDEPFVSPKKHKPDLPDALEAIVLKAIDKNPANRYPNCEVMKAELDAFVAQAPGEATEAELTRWVVEAAEASNNEPVPDAIPTRRVMTPALQRRTLISSAAQSPLPYLFGEAFTIRMMPVPSGGWRLHFKGSLEQLEPKRFRDLLETVHAFARGHKMTALEVDWTELEGLGPMHYPGINYWLGLIRKMKREDRYRLRFRLAPRERWQDTAYRSISPAGEDLIEKV